MNAQQLKNAILQEAIEGRLVPQDPNDEPASVLLARIRKEKERLVKEGKLKKKDLEVKPISEDEIPFEIPESWEWVRLERITDVKGGKRIPVGYKWQDAPTSHIYIRVSDMKDGTISSSDLKYINDEIYNQIKQYTINKEDLYLTIVGSTIGKAGFVPSVFDGMNLTENAVKLSNILICKEYLYYLIISPFAQSQFVDKTKQVGQPKLAINRILSSLLPIPPLAEQKRIVAKIEELLPKVEEYGKAQDALNKLNAELPERLKKSILQEAISGRLVPQDPNDEPASALLARIRQEKEQLVKAGKLKKKDLVVTTISKDEIPFEIPENWEWCRVKSISFKIVDGDHNPPKGLSCDSGYYMLSSKNVNNDGLVELDSVRYLSYEDWEKCNERTSLKKGDVLLTTVGTLGRSCVYEGDIPYCFQRSVSIIQTFVFNYYLKYSFDCPFFQSLIDEKATGTAQRGFYLNQLEDAIIPLPPLAEQHRIVEKLEQVLGKIDEMK